MILFITMFMVILSAVSLLYFGTYAKKRPLRVSKLDYINVQVTYQLLTFLVAGVVLTILYFLNPGNFRGFVSVGNLSAAAGAVPVLGIKAGESWRSLGLTFSVSITLITLLFIYFQFRKEKPKLHLLIPYAPWVLLFALSNSFSEEVIFRLGVIVPLFRTIDSSYLLLLSAVLFGLPHFRGMPSGVAGVLLAGFLGWFLAKSLIETQGLFWAWFIHFLQDVVIFSASILSVANKSVLEKPK